MARPSVSSQAIVDLASSKVQSNRARKGLEDDGSQWSSPSDDESAVETSKNKDLKNKQEQLKNIELIRNKYTLQNKSLAKNNSLMMLRISEMEAKVSDLINENMLLRKRKTLKDIELKRHLQTKLDIVENKLIEKFGEIFEMLKDIRLSEGIPVNSKFNIFKDLLNDAPPTTSTPIEDDSNKANNPFVRAPRPQPLKEDTFVLPKSHLHLQTIESMPENKAKGQNHVHIRKSVPPTERMKDGGMEQHRSSKALADDVSASEFPEHNQKFPKKKIEKTENTKHKQTEKQEKTKDDTKLQNKNVPIEDHKFKVYEDENQDSEIAELVKTKVEPKQSQKLSKAVPLKSPNNDDIQSNEDDEPEINKRPSRNRKPVSYKWPSLSKKMRRQSEKFVDAVIVSEETASNNDTKIKQEPSDNDKKRSSDSIEIRPIKKSKRRPLGNVTAANNEYNNIRMRNQESKSKELIKPCNILDTTENRLEMWNGYNKNDKEDPSIFDFEEENKSAKKYGKRRLSTGKEHV